MCWTLPAASTSTLPAYHVVHAAVSRRDRQGRVLPHIHAVAACHVEGHELWMQTDLVRRVDLDSERAAADVQRVRGHTVFEGDVEAVACIGPENQRLDRRARQEHPGLRVEILLEEVHQRVQVDQLLVPTFAGAAPGVVDEWSAYHVTRADRDHVERPVGGPGRADRRSGRRRRHIRRRRVVGQRHQRSRGRLQRTVAAHDSPVAGGQTRRVRARAVEVVGHTVLGIRPRQGKELLVVFGDSHALGAAIAARVVRRVELGRLEQPVHSVDGEVVRRHVGADKSAKLHFVAFIRPEHRRVRIFALYAELRRRVPEATGIDAPRIDPARRLNVQGHVRARDRSEHAGEISLQRRGRSDARVHAEGDRLVPVIHRVRTGLERERDDARERGLLGQPHVQRRVDGVERIGPSPSRPRRVGRRVSRVIDELDLGLAAGFVRELSVLELEPELAIAVIRVGRDDVCLPARRPAIVDRLTVGADGAAQVRAEEHPAHRVLPLRRRGFDEEPRVQPHLLVRRRAEVIVREDRP